MSKFFKATKQGGKIVIRDEKDRIVRAGPEPRPQNSNPKAHWRAVLRMTDVTGADDILALRNIAHGVPQRRELPDGTYTEWMVPTFETQRQALKDLHELQHGKAVAQTEVLRAEQEAEDVAVYHALSDQQLKELAAPYLERIEAKKSLPKGEEDDSDDS